MGQSFKPWRATAFLAGWVMMAAGCGTPANTEVRDSSYSSPAPVQPPRAAPAPAPAPSLASPQPQSASDKRFIIAPELTSILRVVSVRLKTPPNSYIKIQVNVENLTAAKQSFGYRIEWFDQDGKPIPATGTESASWMLLPHEVSEIVATAPALSAADFGIAFVPTSN